MKITPALPRPFTPPAPQGREAVGAAQPGRPSPDATDEPRRQQTVMREAPVVRPPTVRPSTATTAQADRALAAYAAVATEREQGDLQALLGFDAYA